MRDFPRYDQELIYNKPYDYTFLKTLEALNSVPGWTLEETDQVKGFIVLRNTQYGHLFDRDKWVVRFNVRRLERKKTSVQLAPDSQRNEKAADLLQRIQEEMELASSMKGESLAQLVG